MTSSRAQREVTQGSREAQRVPRRCRLTGEMSWIKARLQFQSELVRRSQHCDQASYRSRLLSDQPEHY